MITIEKGDITKLGYKVDVVVCSCNPAGNPAGGVNGAIHGAARIDRFGSPYLGTHTTEYWRGEPGDLFTICGEIWHVVGPKWSPETVTLAERLLEQTYTNLFEGLLAASVRSVALPSISTGIFHFPPMQAAAIFLMAAEKYSSLDIHMVCFDNVTLAAYNHQLGVLQHG